ncbi:uncharacterized protein LOC129758318 [Uranotaenia lowii]|uniref:uncharacterized protein LOC129758318 n=1 Tax=Uranotaenia lowii TaxID=190385 RepID=UPI002479D2B1|nr:uncharacterized protein LOC129758318 [Uranotaenia lowii]
MKLFSVLGFALCLGAIEAHRYRPFYGNSGSGYQDSQNQYSSDRYGYKEHGYKNPVYVDYKEPGRPQQTSGSSSYSSSYQQQVNNGASQNYHQQSNQQNSGYQQQIKTETDKQTTSQSDYLSNGKYPNQQFFETLEGASDCDRKTIFLLEEFSDQTNFLQAQLEWLSPTLKEIVWKILEVEFGVRDLKSRFDMHRQRLTPRPTKPTTSHSNEYSNVHVTTTTTSTNAAADSSTGCPNNIGEVVTQFLRENMINGIIFVNGSTTINSAGVDSQTGSSSSLVSGGSNYHQVTYQHTDNTVGGSYAQHQSTGSSSSSSVSSSSSNIDLDIRGSEFESSASGSASGEGYGVGTGGATLVGSGTGNGGSYNVTTTKVTTTVHNSTVGAGPYNNLVQKVITSKTGADTVNIQN